MRSDFAVSTGWGVAVVFNEPEIIITTNEPQPVLTAKSDLIQAKVRYGVKDSGGVRYTLSCSTGNLLLKSKPINDGKELSLDPVLFNAACLLDKSGFYIDESSGFNFNKLNFTFFYKHVFSDADTVTAGLKLQYCKMTDVLGSFSDFKNKDIYSVSFNGGFAFDAGLSVEISNPENYAFKLDTTGDLSVADMGRLNLDFLKAPFYHSVHRNGERIRVIRLGPENPSFTRLEDISPYLVKAVVCAEDRNFYQHKGVDIQDIGLAVGANIMQRRFARGASTITMQLVKNLFLDHSKTIYRKAEELILTWLLEHVAGVGKKRQLEIYLNIVEFGPNIYGLSEASKFYFEKAPRDLTLEESLVLTYILPRPTFFHANLIRKSPGLFDELAKHVRRFFRLLMLRGCIDYERFNDMPTDIKFGNGLGTFSLAERIENLDSYLQGIYTDALRLWISRHKYCPRPFIVCDRRPGDQSANLRKGGGLAFDVEFRDTYYKIDCSDELFVKFADLVSELDVEDKILWGGSFTDLKDLTRFEIKR
jgi:hypothetical protein